MEFKLILSSEEILNHVFKSSYKGYDPLSVDLFLDEIIKDYKTVELKKSLLDKDLENALKEKQELIKKIRDLDSELAKYKARYSDLKPTDNVNLDNLNYIRRINALETFLFKNGFDPSKIK